ncbi:hypothetical protein [uncultured Winogradskyella sp.]|uniref:hypothetical protein n=1 Tax=uncultured Winogradskyella sp. TaxID=395353 RepID=UPI0026132DB6|nr:hypothetical protein [uncultured Winogradskyella sp.]
MKKHLKILVLVPCLFAALCDPIEDNCTLIYEDPETYTMIIESTSDTFMPDETIWIDAKTSSSLINICDENAEPQLVTDNEVFFDGFYVLKLNDNLENLNAELAEGITVVYDIGESFTFNDCNNSINILPELTDDNQFYQYRIGLSVSTPGDYCVVSSRKNNFIINQDNNSSIFDNYNTLNNVIRFDECNFPFAREGTEGHYFFKIEE